MLNKIKFPAQRADVGVSPYLDGVLPATVFDLDATIAASYSGSGTTWSNLVTAPADGAAQSDYDFFRGDGATSTTYPTFNGSAGDPAAYWSFDGGDYFRIKSGANTPLLRDAHKSSGSIPVTFGLAFRTPATGTLTNWLFGTARQNANHGFALLSSSGTLTLRQYDGGGAATTTIATALSAGTDYLLLLSFDYTNDIAKIWINSATGSDLTLVKDTTVTDGSNPYEIGAVQANAPLINGHRVYWSGLFNEVFNDAKAAAIIAALEARHGRDYTP